MRKNIQTARTASMAFFTLTLFLWAGTASAAQNDSNCRKTGVYCLDETPCKDVNGKRVCLSDLGIDCWKYEDRYTCVESAENDPNGNTCLPYENDPKCILVDTTCAINDEILGSGCMQEKQFWECSDDNSKIVIENVDGTRR